MATQIHGHGEIVLKKFEIIEWPSCAMGECYIHAPSPDEPRDLCRPTPARQQDSGQSIPGMGLTSTGVRFMGFMQENECYLRRKSNHAHQEG